MERSNPHSESNSNFAGIGEPVHGADSVDGHCKRYNVGRTSTYEEIKAGRLHARKVGRKTLIDHDEQRRWFNSLPEMKSARAA